MYRICGIGNIACHTTKWCSMCILWSETTHDMLISTPCHINLLLMQLSQRVSMACFITLPLSRKLYRWCNWYFNHTYRKWISIDRRPSIHVLALILLLIYFSWRHVLAEIFVNIDSGNRFCLITLNHYLNQCWFKWFVWHSSNTNFTWGAGDINK